MSDFVYIDPRDIKLVTDGLKNLIPAVQDEVVPDVLKYMQNVVRAYPPYRHVSYKRAYGGWRSDKQRRWFFWALRSGRINVPYKRTQGFSRAWRIEGQGRSAYLINESPQAGFLKGDNEQARMMGMIGWKTTSQDIQERGPRIKAIMDGTAKRVIKRLFRK